MRFLLGAIALAMLLFTTPASALPPEGEWGRIPGTQFRLAEPTDDTMGNDWCRSVSACAEEDFGAWTSFAWDGKSMYSIANGGHGDEGNNAGFRVNILSALQGPPAGATHWEMFTENRPLTVETGQLDVNGLPVCNWPSHGGPAQHTYGGFISLGGGLFYHAGNLGFCRGTVMASGDQAWIIDTNTTPETWTPIPGLKASGGEQAAVFFDGYLWTVTKSGTTKKTDIATQTVLSSVAAKKVRYNGADLIPGSTGYGSQMSSGVVNSQGLMCWNTAGYITCTNLRGGVRDIDGNGVLDNDSPGRMRSFAVGPNAPVGSVASQIAWGKNGWVALPDDSFLIWRGTSRMWRFTPAADFMVSGNATMEEWNPLTGPMPTGSSTNVYQKMFVLDNCAATDASRGWFLVAAVRPDQDLWLYNPVGYDCPPLPPPPDEEEPQASVGGPSSAEFAQLAAQPGVILAQNFNTPLPRTQGLDHRWGSTSSYAGRVDPRFEDGVMKLTLGAQCESNCAGWYQGRFATVGLGQTLTVRFDLKLSEGYFQWFEKQGASIASTHPKLFIISTPGDGDDCSTNQAVMVETLRENPAGLKVWAPRFYLTCTPTNHQDVGSIKIGGSRTSDIQPIMAPVVIDWLMAGNPLEVARANMSPALGAYVDANPTLVTNNNGIFNIAIPSRNRMCIEARGENCYGHTLGWATIEYTIQMAPTMHLNEDGAARGIARVTARGRLPGGDWVTFVDVVETQVKGLNLGYGKIKLMLFPPNLDLNVVRDLPAEAWFDNLVIWRS